MNSKEFINEVKDEAPFIDINDHDKWYVKEEDALKAMQMAVDEEKENAAENTIYSIKKGDFITIYNPTENRYVDGKIERITSSAFYFIVTTSNETTYSRSKWILKIEI